MLGTHFLLAISATKRANPHPTMMAALHVDMPVRALMVSRGMPAVLSAVTKDIKAWKTNDVMMATGMKNRKNFAVGFIDVFILMGLNGLDEHDGCV